MLDSLGPGVKRSTPVAARFYSDIVNASNHSEKAVFSPMSTPRISDVPKLNTVFFAPTNDCDLVDSVKITSSVVVDSAYIVIE